MITLIIIAMWILLMGCWIAELWNDMSDANFWEPNNVQIIGNPESTTEVLDPVEPDQSVSVPEPVAQPETSIGAEASLGTAGIKEFSVTAQDFTCICQVDGNVNVELRVNGDQLEVVDSSGGMQVYDKIGENTYKRSWMGYYILKVDGKDTTVDEEKSVVITLTDDGYIMEHYSGTESSPCCIHTFTRTD